MIQKKVAKYLSRKKYVIEMRERPVDLSEFKNRPTPRLISGLILMALSYLIGWPAVAALTAIAVWLQEPLIAIIGCPTTYALSYMVFILGAWLSRAPHYMGLLAKYAVQSFFNGVMGSGHNK